MPLMSCWTKTSMRRTPSVRATCPCRPWQRHVGTLHPVSIFLAAGERAGNAVEGRARTFPRRESRLIWHKGCHLRLLADGPEIRDRNQGGLLRRDLRRDGPLGGAGAAPALVDREVAALAEQSR